jgi:hypothetical protein
VCGAASLLAHPVSRGALQEGVSIFQSLGAVRSAVRQEFPAGNVSVQIVNRSVLVIDMINAKDPAGGETERDHAKRIAKVALNAYERRSELSQVRVAFTRTAQAGPVAFWTGRSFTFTPGELR